MLIGGDRISDEATCAYTVDVMVGVGHVLVGFVKRVPDV